MAAGTNKEEAEKASFKTVYWLLSVWGRATRFVKIKREWTYHGGTVYVDDWPEWQGTFEQDDPSGIRCLLCSRFLWNGKQPQQSIPAAAGGRAFGIHRKQFYHVATRWVKEFPAEEIQKYTFRLHGDQCPDVYICIMIWPFPRKQLMTCLSMYGVVPVFVT